MAAACYEREQVTRVGPDGISYKKLDVESVEPTEAQRCQAG